MPVIKLQQVKDSSYFCDGRLSIGVYVNQGIVTLIDSGIDTDGAKAVAKAISEKGWKLAHIINTHSHADHCGGNNYFQKIYPDVKIYSTKHEQFFIEAPANEPTCFCGGAAPITELQNKYLQAQPSTVTNVIHPYQDQVLEIDGAKFQIITLPGHTPGMIGVITPDNVLYTGDAIFGKDTFEKHGVLFFTDITNTLATFEKLKNLKIEGCVFYHGGLGPNDLNPIAKGHIERIIATVNTIHDELQKNKHSLDSLTQFVMKHFTIPENVMQFTLTKTCVQAYVTYLQKEKKIQIAMEDGLMVISTPGSANKKANSNTGKQEHHAELDSIKAFETSETDNSYCISLSFNNLKLTGEMHTDMALLAAFDFILSDLKKKNLILNQDTLLEGRYNGSLPYNEKFWGPIKETKLAHPIALTKVSMQEGQFEFVFDKNIADINQSNQFQALVSELANLGIPATQKLELKPRF